MTTETSPHQELAHALAQACVTVLPSSETLTAGAAQPGDRDVVSAFAGAAVVKLGGPVAGRVAILVGEELVEALASSPLGGLDLGAAVQPTFDAAAVVLGAVAGPARSVEPGLVVEELLTDLEGGFHAVALEGSQVVAVILVPDATLAAVVGSPVPSPAAEPGAVASGSTSEASSAARAEPLAVEALPGTAAPVATPVATPGAAEPGSLPAGSLPAGSPTVGSPTATVRSIADGRRGIELLHGVEMEVTVELGRTRMPVRELLALAPGAVLALDRAAGSPADLLVNGRLIARGEVVVVDEDFGLRVTEILDQSAVG